MSAFIVNNKHINAIVTYAVNSNIILSDEAQKVGKMLLRANVSSVNARYNESTKLKDLKYSYNEVNVNEAQVLKAIGCLEYQSCEYKGWLRSKSHNFLLVLINNLSHISRDIQEYKDAEWIID